MAQTKETLEAKRLLTPIIEPEKPRKQYAVFDIETAGLGGKFIVSGFVYENQPTRVLYQHSVKELTREIIRRNNRNRIIYAHNGGEYDFKYVIDNIRETLLDEGFEIHPILGGGNRVIAVKIKRDKNVWELRDSFALLPASLKALTAKYAPEYQKLNIGLENGVLFDPTNKEHMQYLRLDCIGLLQTLIKFDSEIMRHFGVHTQMTAASTGIRALRRTLTDGHWRQRETVEKYARMAYYGGLTFILDANKQTDTVSVDINSSYPAAYRENLPVHSPFHTNVYYPDLDGFYRVKVKTPRIQLPIIPKRDKNFVYWANGTFETVVSAIEIEYASTLGYDFTIIDGYVFEDSAPVLADFSRICEQKRAELKGTSAEHAIKLLQNAIYGKMGARSVVDRMAVSGIEQDDMTPAIDETTGNIIDGIYISKEEISAAYMQIQWAAYITARARIALHRAVCDIGINNVYYGDTDSIKASKESVAASNISIGNNYGQFKIDDQYTWFNAYGPKFYAGETIDGKISIRAKGIPKKLLTYDELSRHLDGEQVQFVWESVNSTRSVLLHNKPYVETRNRRFSELTNSKNWRLQPDGRVWPIDL